MKILISGGAGFIGSHIAEAYLSAGHEVVIVDNLSSGKRENLPAGARFECLDVRSPEAAELILAERPDAINHLAAQMNVRFSVENPGFDADVNILGLVNLVEAGRKAGTKTVIFSSSGGTVYGEPKVLPTPESEPTIPVCPYGVSKLSGEFYLEYYRRIYGMRCVALRYANVYGPRQDPHGEAGVIAIFSQLALAGKPARVFGDGRQTRDYVYVGDVVRVNVAALESDFNGAMNVGTGKETDVNELASRIGGLLGGDQPAVHEAAKDGEVLRSVLDCSRAREVLGWEPETELEQGLASTVDFFRSRS